MKILICPDKFKGSLNAREVCHAISEGLTRVIPDAVVESVPLADGGEGTSELLTEWSGGKMAEVTVHGPLFAPLNAHYGISGDGHTAFIEMAVASGLTLIKPADQDPMLTTTLGTGELIADALNRNVSNIVLGIGGSATNDAGMGMAAALGYHFYDAKKKIVKPTGENLIQVRHIDTRDVNPMLKHVTVITLCDVTNPLFGPNGAAYVYGPQKGANKASLAWLDAGLQHFGDVIVKELNCSVDFPGAGAAGGLGAGCKAFLNASMEKGIAYMIRHTMLAEKIRKADLVVTGEGKIDQQTFSGKVVSEVTRLSREAGKPVIAVCGKCELPKTEIQRQGISQVISLVDDDTSPESAMKHASAYLTMKISRQLKNLPGF